MVARLNLLVVAPIVMAAQACSSIVTTPPAKCAELIPREWAEGVTGTPLPTFTTIDQIADPRLRAELESREWQKAFVGQSTRLEMANGRGKDTIFIITNCERLHNEARDAAQKKWWQFWR